MKSVTKVTEIVRFNHGPGTGGMNILGAVLGERSRGVSWIEAATRRSRRHSHAAAGSRVARCILSCTVFIACQQQRQTADATMVLDLITYPPSGMTVDMTPRLTSDPHQSLVVLAVPARAYLHLCISCSFPIFFCSGSFSFGSPTRSFVLNFFYGHHSMESSVQCPDVFPPRRLPSDCRRHSLIYKREWRNCRLQT